MKIIYNPVCSKCQATLALIRENGVEPELINYLDGVLTIEDIRSIHEMLDAPIMEMVRESDPVFEAAISKRDMEEEDVYKLLAENPKVIERPIVIENGKAIVCRPPEKVLAFFK